MADPPSPRRLRDLRTDLSVEIRRLEALVDGLHQLADRWEREGADSERVDAAALRLQSLYTGIERCLVQILRVLNGGTPEGSDWHRRLLQRLTIATESRPALLSAASARGLGELMGFRHLVRHLYSDDLDPLLVLQRLTAAITLWPVVRNELEGFDGWLRDLITLAESC